MVELLQQRTEERTSKPQFGCGDVASGCGSVCWGKLKWSKELGEGG